MNLRDTIKRILNEELGDTKSNYEKQVALLKRLLKSKSYEGVCGYNFVSDIGDDGIARVIVKFAEEWYRSSDDTRDLNRKIGIMSTIKLEIKEIGKKFLGIENFYVGSYLVKCNSPLNEQETPKDVAFQKALRRVIPDGSVYKSSYPLPYSDEGDVHVIMKYSVLPTSRIMKMGREDGSEYDGLQLHLMVDELIWKSDFDKEWEPIRRPHDIGTRFWSEFEDDMSDLFRKKMGMGYVDTYFKHPDITHL